MRTFSILSDSSCDLDRTMQEQFDIEIVPGHVRTPDGRDLLSYPDWEYATREEFYADLKKNPNGYTTSPPNVAEYAARFEACAARGEDVLCITISRAISGSYDFALQARTLTLEKYPERTICCVDSQRFGPGQGLMVTHAAQMRGAGQDLAAVTAYLEDNKNRYHQAGWLDDLSFVASKGRITHPKAFFGTLAGVKPIGEFDYNGLTTVIGKIKGARAAYRVLLKYIEQTIENPEQQTIFLAQTNRLPQAEEYRRMIEERFHPRAVQIMDVHTMCGVNVGPGLMAAYYVGKPISSDLSVERAIIEQAAGEG